MSRIKSQILQKISPISSHHNIQRAPSLSSKSQKLLTAAAKLLMLQPFWSYQQQGFC